MTYKPKFDAVYKCEWCRCEVTEGIVHDPLEGSRGDCPVCGHRVALVEHRAPSREQPAREAAKPFTLVINRDDGTRLALDLVDPEDHAPLWGDACECDECAAYWAVHKLAMEVPEDLGRWRELPPEPQSREAREPAGATLEGLLGPGRRPQGAGYGLGL